jgi:Flp pilus assembly protein TadD
MISVRQGALLLAVVLINSALWAQQAPPPPGTSTTDTAPAANSATDPLATAESAIEVKNLEAAKSDLERYLRDHPADARAWFDLGYVEDAEDHAEAAAADYRKAAAVDPPVI